MVCALVASLDRPARAADEASPPRPLPNYDGRGTQPEGDGAGTWVARVLLSPLYLTSELLLRRPLSLLVPALERARLLDSAPSKKPSHLPAVSPVVTLESSFLPSVGVLASWDDFVPKNELRLRYETWPTYSAGGEIVDRYSIDRSTSAELRAVAFDRPDEMFFGVGPSTEQSHQSRFTERRFESTLKLERRYWRASRIAVSAGVRKIETSHGQLGDDPSVERAAAAGDYALPFGFGRGFVGPTSAIAVSLDTRRAGRRDPFAFAMEGLADQGSDVTTNDVWMRWGGSASVFFDLDRHERILQITGAAYFAESLHGDGVPFVEQVRLGGDAWLHGFSDGRLTGRSAAIAAIQYGWPVAPKLRASLDVAVGNVFGDHLADFRPELLRLSSALGIATPGERGFRMSIGVGTETFASGATLDSVRFMFGIPRAF